MEVSEAKRLRQLEEENHQVDWARDQNAGGGRMNWEVVGRKISETSAPELARTAVAKTGADTAGWVVLAPA